jgi:DNA-binding transcriptional LysR family regulator
VRPQLDLNLLFIVESLYRTLNVSKTAHELHMSQSAVSHALTRVRDHFGDPLFVRVSRGMAATDLAMQLKPSIEAFVQQAREVILPAERFDPQKAKGRITIATTDMVEIILMPRLLQRMKREAPGLQVSIRPTNGDLPKTELENGVCDLAIAGFYKNLPEGFYQAKLLEQRFSTAWRKNHSFIRGKLKPAQYYDCDHALITLQGDFRDNHRKTINGKRKERKFVFGSYSFTGLAWTLASTDLVLTAPTILLNKYKEHFPIQVQDSPIDIPKIEIRMLWHALTHRDPLKVWFRSVLKEEFAAMG